MCVHTIITKAKTNKREKNDEFVEHLELCARYASYIVPLARWKKKKMRME